MSRFWSSSLTLCVDNGPNNTGSYRFNSASADKATNTGSAVIYHTRRLNNTWVHPANLTKSNCIVLGLVNDQTSSWLFIFHTCWNIQNSRAYIMNASAVFADRFARFWMVTYRFFCKQHFTLLNCWRSMSCLANHVTEFRLFHAFDKRWVRPSGVPLWTLRKGPDWVELATFSASLA